MAKTVGQLRYYGPNNSSNYPSGNAVTPIKLIYGQALHDAYPIIKLGIQTLPGTKIFINNSPYPIVIGTTGIYELDIDGLSYINQLTIDQASLDKINDISTAYLIIDYVSAADNSVVV